MTGQRIGGDARDAFTVVAPSLPGYGLSFRPGQKRFGVPEMADCVSGLMHDVLGYRRFGAQGGDWGAAVTSRLFADGLSEALLLIDEPTIALPGMAVTLLPCDSSISGCTISRFRMAF